MAEISTPWRTVKQVAERWQCGPKVVYDAIKKGRVRAVRLNGRRDLRIHESWADAALERMSAPIVANGRVP